MKRILSIFLVVTMLLTCGLVTSVPVAAQTQSGISFTAWTENLSPIYHVGLSCGKTTDTNWTNYCYIAQPFIPAESTVYGVKLPLNLTHGDARVHTEIRSTLDGAALATGDTVIRQTVNGSGMKWYNTYLRTPLTVTPGQTYYLVYYLTGRETNSVCIAYGTDLGANKATHPGAMWQMSKGTPITFSTLNNQLHFGFELIAKDDFVDEDEVYTILAASDFQTKGKSLSETGQYDVYEASAEGAGYLKNMMTSVARDHSDIDAFFFGGDYSHGGSDENHTNVGKKYLEETVYANGLSADADRVYITGNHETNQEYLPFIAASGGYDKGAYALYVINDENHPYHLSDRSQLKQITETTANELEAWLNTQTPGEKPIFVLSHIQLHYSTATRRADDALYAQYLVDVLNRAGQKGHNIIFLYGHNHAGGFDTYMGGSTNFKTKGETIWVTTPGDSMAAPVANDLYFTYMNYGYLGYYEATTGDNAFTMTVFEIRDNKVVVKRYDQQGRHDVQAVAGKYWVSTVHDDTNYGYQPDTVTAEYGYEIGAINGFTYWVQDLNPVYHVGLSTGTSSDTNWGNYRYIAQPFVPETETLYGVQLPLNLSHGSATIHLEIRSTLDGQAIASGDTTVTHLGSGMQWYEAKLQTPATLQPGRQYYFVYYLTAREANSQCIAYGTDLGANKATHPGAVWKMADGTPITFTTMSNQIHFGFKLIADGMLSDDEQKAKDVTDQIEDLYVTSLKDQAAVVAARTAYDALTDTQKALVDNYDKLLAAEAQIKELTDAIINGETRMVWHDFDTTGDSNAPAGMPARWMMTGETVSGTKSLGVKTNEGQKTVNQFIIPKDPMDASLADYIAFDLYCSRDIAGSEISDAGISVGDLNVWDNGGSVAVLAATLKQNGLKKGWNSFILPVQWSNAAYDKTQIRCGRIYIVFNQIEAGVEFSYDDVAFATRAGLGVLEAHNQAKAATIAIRAIPAVETLTKNYKAVVDAATAAYNAVGEGYVELVKDTAILTAAQAKMNELMADDLAAAKVVQDQIDALNVQSLNDKPAVEAARAAYDGLTDIQKDLVTNLAKLVDAEAKIAELMVEDQAVVDAINQRIAALPETDEVTYENVDAVKAEIMALDQAIMNLTEEQQQLLVNPEKIGALVAVISRLYDNQVAAQHVMDQIDALTGEDADAIADARRAYDQLTEDQKALVNNLGKLETLENSASVITYGDVDGNGKASSADALEILKAVVGNVTLTDEQTILADVDGDEKISSVDALYILKKVVGKIDKFPVEQ